MLGHVNFDLLADEDNGLRLVGAQLAESRKHLNKRIWPVLDEQVWHPIALFEDIKEIDPFNRPILPSFDEPILR